MSSWGPKHDVILPPSLPAERDGWLKRLLKFAVGFAVLAVAVSVSPALGRAVSRALTVAGYLLLLYLALGLLLTVAARRFDLTGRALGGGLVGGLLGGVVLHEGAGVAGVCVALGVALGLPRAWVFATLRRELAVREPARWLRRQPREPVVWTAAQVIAGRREAGGGVILGTETDRAGWALTDPEQAVLVLGPPRSGKTSSIIIPAVLTAPGPCLATSTKLDVLRATGGARAQHGGVWLFDPLRRHVLPAGVRRLEWSPVSASGSWDGALRMAQAMVEGANVGGHVEESNHWRQRARDVLAPLLFAAAGRGEPMSVVVWQVLKGKTSDAQTALLELGKERARTPLELLAGLDQLGSKERGSIFSAATDAVSAYMTEASMESAASNWDPDVWVRSTDSIYLAAPADEQRLVAPLVCALIDEIRRATYEAHARGELPHPVQLALDEVANIAPLQGLPAYASEGGSQGLQIIACLQDLSQARDRWQERADGFLTLFGSKLILSGIQDAETLEAISVTLGEYDRVKVTSGQNIGESTQRQRGLVGWLNAGSEGEQSSGSSSVTTERQRVLTPGDIAHLPDGRALALDAHGWRLVRLQPAHRADPWRSLTAASMPQIPQYADPGRTLAPAAVSPVAAGAYIDLTSEEDQ